MMRIVKRILFLALLSCFVETGVAMKHKELSRIQVAEKRAVNQLIETGFQDQNTQTCISTLNGLIAKLEHVNDQEGAAVLTLTNLRSIVYIIVKLIEYKAAPTEDLKIMLLSISQSYGGNISKLIHSVVH